MTIFERSLIGKHNFYFIPTVYLKLGTVAGIMETREGEQIEKRGKLAWTLFQ